MAKMTAAARRKLRQDNVNLEYLLRRTRRSIYNETPTVEDRTPVRCAAAEVKVAMSKHAVERCELMKIDTELVRVLVADPAVSYEQREGRRIAQHGQENVAAIYTENADGRTVVTVLFREPFSRDPAE